MTVGAAPHRAGLVALVGRPNVGKSTLLNALVGQKVSITSPKPQTTRHRIAGILTGPGYQAVFLDAPGLHTRQPRGLNRAMNRAALGSLADADLLLFIVDATRWTREDEAALERVTQAGTKSVLVVNKCDRIKPREKLLPLIDRLSTRHVFDAVVPLSALKEDNLERLVAVIPPLLPESEPFYPEDQVTDRSERFLAAELVREKLFRKLGEEIPYGLTVEIERFREEQGVLHIHALVWVDKSRHKAMVIGAKGQLLKAVGREARQDMETAFGHKVFLQIWVKVKEGWADDERALQSLGYRDEG